MPPTFSWGGRSGYLLGAPTFAFIFRFRLPSGAWAGSPVHAPCYDTKDDQQPVAPNEWTPSIYADNFDSLAAFEGASHIGAVEAGEPWPAAAE